MQVIVRLYGHLAAAFQRHELDIYLPEGSTLGSLLGHVVEEWGPRSTQVRALQAEALHILVDGQDSRLLGGKETPLHHQALVDLIPPFAGGSLRGPGLRGGEGARGATSVAPAPLGRG